MAFGGPPLVHKNDHEQRGHGKVDAGQIKGQHAAQRRAGHAARHPVALVQRRDPQPRPVGVELLRDLHAALERVGLVRKRKDHVGLGPAHLPEGVQKGQPVKQMPAVDRKGGQRHRGQRRKPAAQKPHQHKLHRPGVDDAADQKRPGPAVAGLLQQQPEGQPQKQVAAQNRRRLPQRKAKFRHIPSRSLFSFRASLKDPRHFAPAPICRQNTAAQPRLQSH